MTNQIAQTAMSFIDAQEACDFLAAHCPNIDWLGGQNNMTATPQFLAFVGHYILQNKPRSILECGSGLSTLIIASILRRAGTGTLVSLEHASVWYKQTHELLKRFALIDHANVCHAPIREFEIGGKKWEWYDYESSIRTPIDLLVVDGPPQRIQPTARYPVLPLLQDRLSENMVIILDDGHRLSEKNCVERWESEFDVKSVLLPHDRGTFFVSAKDNPFFQKHPNGH